MARHYQTIHCENCGDEQEIVRFPRDRNDDKPTPDVGMFILTDVPQDVVLVPKEVHRTLIEWIIFIGLIAALTIATAVVLYAFILNHFMVIQ